MNKDKKNILVGMLLGFLAFMAISEAAKYSARTGALADLNESWTSFDSAGDKIAAIIKADTMIAQNQSWFAFSNSSADENAEEFANYDGGDVWPWMDRQDGPEPEVETSYIWYSPEDGSPNPGEYTSYFEVRPSGGR